VVSLRHQKLYAGSRDPMGGAADRLHPAPPGWLVADHGDLAPLDSGRRAYAGDSARARHPPQPNPRRGVPVTRPGALGFCGGAGVGPSSREMVAGTEPQAVTDTAITQAIASAGPEKARCVWSPVTLEHTPPRRQSVSYPRRATSTPTQRSPADGSQPSSDTPARRRRRDPTAGGAFGNVSVRSQFAGICRRVARAVPARSQVVVARKDRTRTRADSALARSSHRAERPHRGIPRQSESAMGLASLGRKLWLIGPRSNPSRIETYRVSQPASGPRCRERSCARNLVASTSTRGLPGRRA